MMSSISICCCSIATLKSSSSCYYSFQKQKQLIPFTTLVVVNKTSKKTSSSTSPLSILCLRQQPKIAVVTKKSWDNLILKSDTPVLVEFYASWCGPCQMVHRVIDELAVEYVDKLKCFVLQADEDSSIAEEYDIKAVPVVLLFKNGKKIDSVVGTMPKEFYSAAIDGVLSS